MQKVILVIIVSFLLTLAYFFYSKIKILEKVKLNNSDIHYTKIAYFNYKKVLANYNFAIHIDSTLKKLEIENQQLIDEYKNLILKKLKELEIKQGLSINEIRQNQTEISKLETAYQKKAEIKSKNLSTYTFKQKNLIKLRIENFIYKFNQKKQYNFIFSENMEKNIFYVDSTFDITNEIIKGLNEEK